MCKDVKVCVFCVGEILHMYMYLLYVEFVKLTASKFVPRLKAQLRASPAPAMQGGGGGAHHDLGDSIFARLRQVLNDV